MTESIDDMTVNNTDQFACPATNRCSNLFKPLALIYYGRQDKASVLEDSVVRDPVCVHAIWVALHTQIYVRDNNLGYTTETKHKRNPMCSYQGSYLFLGVA